MIIRNSERKSQGQIHRKKLTLGLRTGKAKEPKIPKSEATAVRTPNTVSGTPESYTNAAGEVRGMKAHITV